MAQKMKKINDYKKVQLEENWNTFNFNCMNGEEVSFAHYVCVEANNDPGFFRWLFENDELSDFECEDEAEFRAFVQSIEVAEDADDYDVNEQCKTKQTYTKTFSELSDEERKSFLSLSEPDGTILALINAIKKEESVNINVAFNAVGTAIDYCVFDPYHLYTDVYTDATGWSEWLCGLNNQN